MRGAKDEQILGFRPSQGFITRRSRERTVKARTSKIHLESKGEISSEKSLAKGGSPVENNLEDLGAKYEEIWQNVLLLRQRKAYYKAPISNL